MCETALEPITKDEESGKFLPENVWRYRPGQSGKVARYSYRSVMAHIKDYWELCATEKHRYTWAGLAEFMGCTRQNLDGYRQATVQCADATRISAVLAYYSTCIESQLEQRLTDRLYSTASVIRGLQAIDQEKWGDNKKIDIDVKQQISISLDPDSALAKRLNGAGVTIDQHPEALEKPV